MKGNYPAPWRVDSYALQSGGSVCEVRDALGCCVVTGVSQDVSESVVLSRNAASDIDGAKSVTDAYQGAIDTLNLDIQQLRQKWQKEVADLNSQIDRYRLEIDSLRKDKGLLL